MSGEKVIVKDTIGEGDSHVIFSLAKGKDDMTALIFANNVAVEVILVSGVNLISNRHC
ncbi:hypothetical protein KFV08_02580 [Macrococcoides canis]|uniref:carbohydrate kinase family protein n=1 Tax=Macrococcoides canis TaxID=1855823 RepID=UPI00207CEDEC|nr:hypothetical protein [Macrococcus canis]UTH09681.1 hypothetical protein KFV08_02580 [Macrococcus canis]